MSHLFPINSATRLCRRCTARREIAATFAALFDLHDDIAVVRWVQHDPDAEIDALVVEFTDGDSYHAHDSGPQRRAPPPEAYAVLVDLVLYNPDLLHDAFGLGVSVVATRGGLDAKPLPR
jgi:hypothetical protein